MTNGRRQSDDHTTFNLATSTRLTDFPLRVRIELASDFLALERFKKFDTMELIRKTKLSTVTDRAAAIAVLISSEKYGLKEQ